MKITQWWLRYAALRLTAHGWPVTPGARLASDRFDCDRPGCFATSCHPALERWEEADYPDRMRVAGWWRQAPYSVLLPTGLAFDALEVPAALGVRALTTARPPRGPVAVTPTGRWMFLVQPGGALLPELARRPDLVRHGRGSWIPAPPTRLPEGPVRWAVSPREVSWRLPAGHAVQRALTGQNPAAAAA